jgi:hypothetical protein
MVACAAGVAHAQAIHGRVLLPDSIPAAGSMVTATGSGGVEARTIASRTGAYRLTLPRGGHYELRALRIGFTPTVVPAVDVAPGEDRAIDIVLASQPVRLATLNIDARDNCGLRGPEATAFLQLWEQARAALAATSLGETSGSLDMRVVRIDGTVENDGSHPKIDSAGARETIASRPFATTPAETLAAAGYLRPRRDGSVVFDVPGADAFLSDAFVATHCFRVEDPPGDHRDWIGIGFRPVKDPDTTTDISGVMWLDRATAELRRLEFGYVNVIYFPQRICDNTKGWCIHGSGKGAGGSLDFARLADGEWLIRRWLIRTPAENIEYRADFKVRQSPGGFEKCYDNHKGCEPLSIPHPKLATNFGSIATVSRAGHEMFNDDTTIAAMARIAAKAAGRHPAGISGFVSDATTGQPLPRVVVSTEDPARAAITNDSGYFELPTLPAKTVGLTARRSGYDPIGFRLPLLADSTRHLKLSLVPTSSLRP